MGDITDALLTMHEVLDFIHPLILGTPYAPDQSYEAINVKDAFTVPWVGTPSQT